MFDNASYVLVSVSWPTVNDKTIVVNISQLTSGS